MRRHAARPDPRAHWLLLGLGTALLLGMLALDGYQRKESEFTEPQWHQSADEAIIQGEPVIRFEQGLARSVHTAPGAAALIAQPLWLRALEIRLGANAIAGVTGKRTALFRPPSLGAPEDLTDAHVGVMRQAADEGYLVVLSDVEGVVDVDDAGELEQSIVEGVRYTTVTEAVGAASALAPAPTAMRVSGEMLRVAQATAAVAATVVTGLLAIALLLALLHIAFQLVAAFRRRMWADEVLDPAWAPSPGIPRWPTPARFWASGSQVTYLVVLQSVVTALGGNRLRWHRQRRTGSAAAELIVQR